MTDTTTGPAPKVPLMRRLIPDDPAIRVVTWQSIASAAGDGAFLAGNAVYFTIIIGMSATQVGFALSAAALAAVVTAVPTGRLVDKMDVKQAWLWGSFVRAALFFVYPFIHELWEFIALLVVMGFFENLAWNARQAYVLDVFDPNQRVRAFAYVRSARNIGYTLGALLGGIALASGSRTFIESMPLITAGILFVNVWLIMGAPPPRSQHHADPADPSTGQALGPRVWANKGYVVLQLANSVVHTDQILLNVVVPLWLVERTDAPHQLLAWLFATNTILAVLFTVPMSRKADSVAGSLRLARRGAVCMVASCGILAITHDTVGWVSIVLLWIGHISITGSEIWGSASSWGLAAELTDPRRKGEYSGVGNLAHHFTDVLGPFTFTWLAMAWGPPGFAVIAVAVVVALVIVHVATPYAEGFLLDEGFVPGGKPLAA